MSMPNDRPTEQQDPMDVPPAGDRGSPSLLRLFMSFLRLGATAFGGPAMVAYIHEMAVERNEWLDEVSFQDGVALCQTIPGATAMKAAAYVGLRSRGVWGALFSFVGFGLPAFCLMVALSAAYGRTHELPLVQAAFQGLRAITVAIVANAAFSFGKRSLKGPADVLIAGLAGALFALRVNPIAVIVLAALLGVLLYGRRKAAPDLQAGVRPAIPGGWRWQLALLLLVAAASLVVLFVAHRELFDLGVLMLRIDLFAFGGGFASVPLMYHEVVDVRSWMDEKTFMNGIALGQVTPGPIVITATFVGYLMHGMAGAVVATICIFIPSFLLVVGIVPYFDRLRASEYFSRCMAGILASFVGLLFSVTVQFGLGVSWDVWRIALAAAALTALLLGVDVLWVVLVGVAASAMIL